MARTSTARMKPAQATREQIIASMIISGGMTNDQVYAAFESTHPQLIKDDDPRRAAGLVKEPYDADERARFARAVRSVRGLAQKAAGNTQELLDIMGNGETRPANQVAYENIKRWSCGDPVMDYIYGHTHYRWLIPEEMVDKVNPATGKPWDYGDEIPNRLHKYLDPMTGLPADEVIGSVKGTVQFGDKTGYTEQGIPTSFVSCWGGAKGTGKSKLAIAVEKTTCLMDESRAVIHNYGESNLAQLRQWIGPKAPDNLIIGERKSLAQIVSDIYKWKPRLYVQDSLQTIIEAQDSRGLKDVLATFKQIATEEAAGFPHILVISQLNKKGDLKGTSDIGHIVDAVMLATKSDTRKGVFYFVSDKNRGGETPRGAHYQHTDDGIVSLGTGSKNKPVVNLTQKSNPVLASGVMDPSALPDDGGEDIPQ